jgi:hypothetical protein
MPFAPDLVVIALAAAQRNQPRFQPSNADIDPFTLIAHPLIARR